MSFMDEFLSGFNDFLGKTKNPKGITRDSLVSFNNESDRIYKFTEIHKYSHADDDKILQYFFKLVHIADNEQRFIEFVGEDTRVYEVYDTVPFSEEFLDMVGNLYFNTPDGTEYIRTIAPNNEDRIDSVTFKIDIYNLQTGKTAKKELQLMYYDINIFPEDRKEYIYSDTECLQIEMNKENGLFTMLRGYKIDDFMYKIFKSSDDNSIDSKI